MGGKCVPLEASAHVPFIVRPPHAARDTNHAWRGSVNNDFVCLADIMPTFLSVAGVAIPDECDGNDLSVVCQGETIDRDTLYTSCMYMHAVRQGDWKLCRETINGAELLFNVVDDPLETTNRLRDPAVAQVESTLRSLLDRHISDHDLGDLSQRDPGVINSTAHLPHSTHPGMVSGRPR